MRITRQCTYHNINLFGTKVSINTTLGVPSNEHLIIHVLTLATALISISGLYTDQRTHIFFTCLHFLACLHLGAIYLPLGFFVNQGIISALIHIEFVLVLHLIFLGSCSHAYFVLLYLFTLVIFNNAFAPPTLRRLQLLQ